MEEDLVITAEEMQAVMQKALLKYGYDQRRAETLAGVFTNNTVDGVATHGINRFPRFIEYIQKGWVKLDAEPFLKRQTGVVEQWDGALAAGPLNALMATERSMELARTNGMGCVALSNTNHWMRGGTYAWKAAENGMAFIGWTNTIANMPPWNAVDNKLGNNPLVLGVPFEGEAIVMDMAMSQFSFGALEAAAENKKRLPVTGGFDGKGNLTDDPAAVIESRRILPAGYWKGAGLSLLLDLLAAILSGGKSTAEISAGEAEYAVSQVFICFHLEAMGEDAAIPSLIKNVIEDYKNAAPAGDESIVYPGENVLSKRKFHLAHGMKVRVSRWHNILSL